MQALKRTLHGCMAFGLLTWGCAGAAPKPASPDDGPPPISYNIGDECIAYRYASLDRCNENDVTDCQEATSDGDCGIPNDFVFTNAYCTEGQTFFEYQVNCQGFTATGPLPQPQCPDGHALGDWVGGQCQIGSCTDHCADFCTSGYCTGPYTLCYLQYAPECDCGTVTCPPTGPCG